MAIQLQININKSGDGVTYDPSPLEANGGDQIFWTNNDDKPHWPCLAGDPLNSKSLMPNQIAPGSSSPIFSPSTKGTIDYVCFLEPAEQGGSIVVKTSVG